MSSKLPAHPLETTQVLPEEQLHRPLGPVNTAFMAKLIHVTPEKIKPTLHLRVPCLPLPLPLVKIGNLAANTWATDAVYIRWIRTTDLSWWPKPAAWSGAGINLGYWSEDCERWFQGQLTKMQEGKYTLRSPSAWKNGLKFYKSTSRVSQKTEQWAAEYLKQHNI